MEGIIRPISGHDRFSMGEVDTLLRQEGLTRDGNLDYTCGIYNSDEELIATGSCFGNTIRCLAVSGSRRGEGHLVTVVSHLLQVQAQRGNLHVFLYTKCANIPFFADLGFSEIARVGDQMVFLENRRDGFRDYLKNLPGRGGVKAAAVVMNCNPFTLGHRYLLEQASAEHDIVYLFLLSENAGPIPHSVRRMLVKQGISDLPKVVLVETGPYLISSATFPTYFLRDQDSAITAQAKLDAQIFLKIAAQLGITCRYLGQEPASHVTGLYNTLLKQILPAHGIECCEIPRLEVNGQTVSASSVRLAIQQEKLDVVRHMLPDSTYRFFASAESEPIRNAIRAETQIVHY